jgi:hypothetical protein
VKREDDAPARERNRIALLRGNGRTFVNKGQNILLKVLKGVKVIQHQKLERGQLANIIFNNTNSNA